MLGAMIGDIVGSVYEFHNIKTKDFPLFREDCFFTDDTVMTAAVAEGVMNGCGENAFIDAMKKYGRMYPNAGYGVRFGCWLRSDDRKPYGSFGNGSAMRVSPMGWFMDCRFCARTGLWPEYSMDMVKRSAAVTHNHPEGIKGAAAVADAIFICRMYRGNYEAEFNDDPNFRDLQDCKRYVRERMEQYGYDLSKTLGEIRPTYYFNETCQQTVPQAVTAFLESTDFEDAIRNAISLGGDSDTLAAITGSIAEAAYGIPEEIAAKAWDYLDGPLKDVCRKWKKFLEQRGVQNITALPKE